MDINKIKLCTTKNISNSFLSSATTHIQTVGCNDLLMIIFLIILIIVNAYEEIVIHAQSSVNMQISSS